MLLLERRTEVSAQVGASSTKPTQEDGAAPWRLCLTGEVVPFDSPIRPGTPARGRSHSTSGEAPGRASRPHTSSNHCLFSDLASPPGAPQLPAASSAGTLCRANHAVLPGVPARTERQPQSAIRYFFGSRESRSPTLKPHLRSIWEHIQPCNEILTHVIRHYIALRYILTLNTREQTL